VLVLFWAANAVRAAVAFVRGQALGADAVLAVVGLLAVPYLSRGALRWWWIRRCRKRFRA
jgi:hypothetical protein